MNEIICRHASSNFNCLMTAQGMEDAGCSVISITIDHGAPQPMQWIAWGRYKPGKTSPEQIDQSIIKRLYPD